MIRQWWTIPILLAGVLALGLAGPADFGQAQPPPKEKGPKDKDKKGKGKDKGPEGKSARHLRRAYDTLTEVALLQKAEGRKLPRDFGRLLDQAKEFYRTAHKNYRDGNRPQAAELALAANDAARGLKHVLRADLPAAKDLPAPPDGAGAEAPAEPWETARNELQRARDRLSEIRADVGPGKTFADASRQLYEQARRAYLDRDYPRAAELARGAEAWSHVAEHLERGQYATGRGAEDRRVPPPPAALGEKELAPPPSVK